MKRCFILLVVTFAGCLLAYTVEQTNEVVHAALDRVRAAISIDVVPEDSVATSNELALTWNAFLGSEVDDGWTVPEKKLAFDAYLQSLETADVRNATRSCQEDVRLAIHQCEVLAYSNAVPALRNFVLNTNAVYRDEAIAAIIQLNPVDASLTQFVETVFTNVTHYSLIERGTSAGLYTEKIAQLSTTNEIERAVKMLYRNRKCSTAAALAIDTALVRFITDYRLSSNRLDTALFILGNAEADDDDRRDFTAITNQLLSSGQPLQWITVGDSP